MKYNGRYYPSIKFKKKIHKEKEIGERRKWQKLNYLKL